eukprot:4872789-Pyramimonas_sp.AAC.1
MDTVLAARCAADYQRKRGARRTISASGALLRSTKGPRSGRGAARLQNRRRTGPRRIEHGDT